MSHCLLEKTFITEEVRAIHEQKGQIEDFQLLRRFVEGKSQDAFAQLVERRLGFVYAICRREVGEDTLAEDVTQAVFLILAQKAPKITNDSMMAGWLFQTARYASRNALRRETRRQDVEKDAMTEMVHRAEEEQNQEDMWQSIEPLLNDGIAALSAKDREAILLRFFESHSFKEVAHVLDITEATARKRVERALGKLKQYLQKRGVVVSLALLAYLLTERAVMAVPATCLAVTAELIAGISANAIGVSSGAAYGIYKGVLIAMMLNQIKVATIVAGLSLISAAGVMAVSQSRTTGKGNSAPVKNAKAIGEQVSAKRPEKAQDLFKQVLDNYRVMGSFSMRVQHHNSSGLYPGDYTQTLQWKRGGHFELLVMSNNKQRSVPNFYANGTQVVTVMPDGKKYTDGIRPRPNSAPGWEVSGGMILGTLQFTEIARILSNPTGRWKYGTRKEWHKQKVQEIVLQWDKDGESQTFHCFLSEDGKSLVGVESWVIGEPGWETYFDQKVNPKLPSTLGNLVK